MAEQEKRTAPAPAEADQVAETAKTKAKDTSLADGLDDILDEIDEVLETNAEEFVKVLCTKGWPVGVPRNKTALVFIR